MYRKEWVGGQKTDMALKEMKSNEAAIYRCGSPIYRALAATLVSGNAHADVACAYGYGITNSPTDAITDSVRHTACMVISCYSPGLTFTEQKISIVVMGT